MRAAIVIAAALALSACGKKEAPAAAGARQNCHDNLSIVLVAEDKTYTVLEQQSDGKPFRFTQPGVLGRVGEQFSICLGAPQ